MKTRIEESLVEDVAIDWLASLGYSSIFGPANARPTSSLPSLRSSIPPNIFLVRI